MELKTEYYTPQQVAEMLQIHLNSVYNWLLAGRLKGVRVGSLWRIRQEDIDAFIKAESPK